MCFCLLWQILGNKLDELTDENTKIGLQREKMEDDLKEKQRKLEGQELVSAFRLFYNALLLFFHFY